MNVFDYVMESTNIEFHTPEELLKWMNQNIRYSEFTKLKSPEEVYTSKCGSCHDQVMFELYHLRKMGLKPKAEFFIEYHPHKVEGGMTHSFIYYKKDGKVCWFEHAWGDMKGIHTFKSLGTIKKYIRDKHKNGDFGNYKEYPNLQFKIMGSHTPGESLGELVSKALN